MAAIVANYKCRKHDFSDVDLNNMDNLKSHQNTNEVGSDLLIHRQTCGLKNNEEHKTFLIISSCLGYQFDLKVLSKAAGLSLIETAKKIEEISFNTGIFESLPNHNNKIKFRNRATLNALIKIFSLNNDLENFGKILKLNNIKFLKLPVSAPFHCSLMKKATIKMRDEIEKKNFISLLEKYGASPVELLQSKPCYAF